MNADIRILSTDLRDALPSYIERRLHFSLWKPFRQTSGARHGPRITRC